MPAYQGGRDMILTGQLERSTYNACPTSSRPAHQYPGRWGSGGRSTNLERIDFAAAAAHEHALLDYATGASRRDPRCACDRHGNTQDRRAVVRHRRRAPHDSARSWTTRACNPHGASLRHADHGALRHPATARASFAFYNNRADVDRLIAGFAPGRGDFPWMTSKSCPGSDSSITTAIPENFGELGDATPVISAVNPLCGDKLRCT